MAAPVRKGPEASDVMTQLKSLYFDKIRPLEEAYQFGEFYSPLMKPSDFDSKPMVLLLGQYSVGKTSFIRYIIGKDFPGARIGPEPTTDRFNSVMWGPDDRIIPGNALAVDEDMPFSSLTKFGTEFLNKFQASMCNASVLQKIFFVDTPGVLSGEKQKLGRAYEFVKVTEWFAQRADMILLLFDAHKLDISDEFQAAIKVLKGQDDKIRVVLNKADKVTSQQLMRVYGAMMWSLGKVVNTPEVMRVYIGSFWEGKCMNEDLAPFFRAEQADLLRDLHDLPRNSAVRKINELVKRARMARVHALIIGHLRAQMPMFSQKAKQASLLKGMRDEFYAVMTKHRLPQGDFPNVDRFIEVAATFDFGKFRKLEERLLANADSALTQGIPVLLRQLGHEQDLRAAQDKEAHASFMEGGVAMPVAHAYTGTEGRMIAGAGREPGAGGEGDDPVPSRAAGGPAEGAAAIAAASNPFGGPAPSRDQAVWASNINKKDSDSVFRLLPGGQEGRVSGAGAKDVLLESGLDVAQLRAIWELADIDKDGCLDAEEFAVCQYLINMAKDGKPVPASLPPNLVPPSKKL